MLTLAQIEAAVAGRTQFVRKDFQLAGRDLVLFDYLYAFPALFDEADGLAECRGITFDKLTGEIVSRPYHKFFNAGEIPGTGLDVLDLTVPHVILEKLDGSMIRVVNVDSDGTVFFGTRMGVTDIALQAHDFARKHPQYTEYSRAMFRAGYTAIFEWCSRQNRVVIDHPVDRLVLTGVRSMADGTYMKFSEMRALAEKVDVECVQAFDLNTGDRAAFESYVRGLLDTEGFVIRFENGYMVKVKADDYVARHKTLGLLRSEKTLFETMLTGMLDDVLPRFSPADQSRVRDFYERFVQAMDVRVKECREILAQKYADRKDFALKVAARHGASGALFQAFGNPDADLTHLLWGVMRKPGTVDDPDRIRRILGAPELVWDAGRRILTGNDMKLCDHCSGELPTGDGDFHADPQVCFETLQGFLDLSHKQADSTQGSLREVQRVLGLSEDSPVTEVVNKVKALRERVDALESALWRLRLSLKDHDTAICGLLKVKP